MRVRRLRRKSLRALPMRTASLALPLAVALWAVTDSAGCSSTTSTTDAASGGSGGGGAAGGAGGAAGGGGAGGERSGTGGSGGATSCGGSICTSSQVCVHPSCGGGTPPQCSPLTVDGGQCPSGWTYEPQCPPGVGTVPGCLPPPCTPPEPFCTALPPACSGTPTCTCLPQSICMPDGGSYGGQCFLINGRSVMCGSA